MKQADQGGMQFCDRCGKENFAFASFCIGCGDPLEAPGTLEFKDEQSKARNEESRPTPSALSPAAQAAMSRRARLKRWESIVGVALLLLTVGYAVFNWQHSNAQSAAYHAGLSAEANKNWEKAVDSYREAGDTQDAPARLENAQSKIKQRDTLYALGMSEANNNQLEQAISDLQELQAVQPGYKDSATKLSEARDQAFRRGLAGVIYLVNDGTTPGLYMRDPAGRDRFIPGSDAQSTVRAISPDSTMLVYDRQSSEKDYYSLPLRHNSIVGDPFGPDKTDRIPVLARINPDGSLTTVALPHLDPSGQGVFTGAGLWWYSSNPGLDFFGDDVFYDPDYTNPDAEIVRVSDRQNGLQVVAVDPPHSRLILAQTTGKDATNERRTTLYAADAEGKSRQLLQTFPGNILQATVSPEGRRLLYITQAITQDTARLISRSVWVAPLDRGPLTDGSGGPFELETLSWVGAYDRVARLTASLLPDGTATKLPSVIVERVENNLETLTVHNLNDSTAAKMWEGQPDGLYGRSMAGFSAGGSYMAFRRQQGSETTVEVVGLEPGKQGVSDVDLQAQSLQVVRVQFAPLGNYVLASVQSPDAPYRGVIQKIYSVRVNRDGQIDSTSIRQIAEANLPYGRDLSPVALPPKGYMLVYVSEKQELRAVFLSGNGDTLLAPNVSAVWSMGTPTNMTWWH